MRVPPSLDPRRWWTDALTGDRLLLAAKTAAAAAIAWYLAPLVPFASSDYSYYAPLGVLVSMYPTVARSASSGAQALVGLALGIGLGLASLAAVGAGLPRIAAVAAVILAGVLLAGVRALGVGRDWVAIAGLFVLLLGGADPDGYSSSYLVTMAFGVLVGVAVNLIMVPPLRVNRADSRLTRLRDGLGTALHDISRSLDGRSYDPETGRAAADALAAALADVREEVALADESRRFNPRGRRVHAPRDLNRRRLNAIEATADATRGLAQALAGLTGGSGAEKSLPDQTRHALARSIESVGDLVVARPDPDDTAPRLDRARMALDTLVDRLSAARSTDLDPWAAAVSLRRMIEASAPFASAR